ncbi:MAG: Smr/MutS family protein [Treponema sp.]
MSSFGDILKQFEGSQNKKASKKSIHDSMNTYMDKYGVFDKDIIEEKKNTRVSYKKTPTDDTIDLHGLSAKEALDKLKIFFENAIKHKYKKLSIIHGKGKHSKTSSVLYGVVKKFLEENKNAGKMGFEKNNKGGTGSTWVMLKYDE